MPNRTESFVFGIPQNGLKQKERQVPLDEPPPLAANSELTYIGKPTVRYDGPAKATGNGKYTADIHLPGMLYARMVDATIPHGRIISIDTSAAEKLPGVRAVHVIEHVMGMRGAARPEAGAPSRYPVIRYAGQPIAGVAATSQQLRTMRRRWSRCSTTRCRSLWIGRTRARRTLRRSFPGRQMRRAAQAEAADRRACRRLAMSTDRSGRRSATRRKGWREADVVVEGEYFTQVQTHSALETHGFVVDWKPEEVTVYASTQGTSSVRNEFADVFKLPKSKVRVITEYMGGGFGAKFGAGNEGVVAANLSRKANAPVKLMLDRQAGAYRLQPARLAPEAEDRREEGRHAHCDRADQLRHGRRGNRRRHGGPGDQYVQVPEPADGRVRRLHQRRPGRGVSSAGPSAGMLRVRAGHR